MMLPGAGDGLLLVAVFTWVAALVSGIAVAFGWLGDKAVTIAITVAQAAVMIAVAIAKFALLVAGVFAKLGGLLAAFWRSVLRPFVAWTWQQIDRLAQWLDDTIRPVIEFVEKVREAVDKVYDRWIRPILDTLEVVRRTVQLLERLHIEWARKLDEKLAELEDKIIRPITEIRGYLNEAINRLNSISDGFGLFSRLALLRSLINYEREVLEVWWDSLARRERERAAGTVPQISETTPDAAAREVAAYMATGTSPNAGRIAEYAAPVRRRLLAA